MQYYQLYIIRNRYSIRNLKIQFESRTTYNLHKYIIVLKIETAEMPIFIWTYHMEEQLQHYITRHGTNWQLI